jgi:hypothetical protein
MSRKGDGSERSKWQNPRKYPAVDDVSRGVLSFMFSFPDIQLSCTCKIPFHKNELEAPENIHPAEFSSPSSSLI